MPDITWGDPYEFASVAKGSRRVCEVTDTTFAVGWEEQVGSDLIGKIRVGSISNSVVTFDGNIITFCTKLNVGSWSAPCYDICKLANDAVGIVYRAAYTGSGGVSGLYARILAVDGTSISIGSPTLISGTNQPDHISCCANGPNTIVAASTTGCTVCARDGNVVTAGNSVNISGEYNVQRPYCVSLSSGLDGPVTGKVLVTFVTMYYLVLKAVVVSVHTDLITSGAMNTLTSFEGGFPLRNDTLNSTQVIAMVGASRGIVAILGIDGDTVTEGTTTYVTMPGATISPYNACSLPGNYFACIYQCGGNLKSRYCSYSGSTITLGDEEAVATGTIFSKGCPVGSKVVVAFDRHVKVGLIPNTMPTVTTNTPLDMSCTAAILRGTLDDDGGSTCDCGFEWGLTTGYGNTTITYEKTTGQAFSSILTELDASKEYHYRAFATNAVGTGYGSDETIPIKIPIVTADSSGVDTHVVTLLGEVTTSTRDIDERGFDWGLTDSYGDSWTESNTYGEEEFTHPLTGLVGDTIYHFRAKAHNSCGWGYSADDTFNTGAEVYPTEAITRVTSLVHRWMPGAYTLTIGLGEVTSEFILPDITYIPLGGPIVPPVPPVPPICLEGQYTCFGTDLFVCFEGRWRLALKNAPQCQTGTCIEGSYKCEGKDLYVCFESRWILSLKNAPECKGK